MKDITVSRIAAIDIMRGLTIFLMLFVNDLYEPGVPNWLLHAGKNVDAIGLADIVFPVFLFMVGLAVPFAIESRKKRGDRRVAILGHVTVRTMSLLIIGILIYNGSERINPVLTGIPKLVWLMLLYVFVFLVWNAYATGHNKVSGGQKRPILPLIIRIIGIAGILWLVIIFRAGDDNTTSWLATGWWGILGLIGWGYLAAALSYLFAGKKIIYAVLIWLLALVLNCISLSSWISYFPGWQDWAGGWLSVWLQGNVPSLTLAGLVVGMVLQRKLYNSFGFLGRILIVGTGCIIVGFLLRYWFIFSKIIGTPSWGMVCIGISLLIFGLIFFITDIHGRTKWAYPFQLAGKNALTTYLAPDMIYFLVWYFGWPLFIYKQDAVMWWAVLGSITWSALMIGYAHLLSKAPIRLKL